MAAKLSCSNHLVNDARFRCAGCVADLCTDCVRQVAIRRGTIEQCRMCDGLVTAIAAADLRQRALATGSRAYLSRLGEFLQFPLSKSILFMLLGLAVFAAPLYWAVGHNISPGLALFGFMVMKGLEASIYFRMVAETGRGKTDLDPPDFGDLWEDLMAPFFRYLAALAPFIIAIAMWGDQLGSYTLAFVLFDYDPRLIADFPLPATLCLVGIVFLPLGTIIAAVSESFIAVLTPSMWINVLRVLGTTYLVGAALFYATMAVEVLLWVPLLLEVRAEHSIPVVTTLITIALAYVPMAIRARLLGGLIEPHLGEF